MKRTKKKRLKGDASVRLTLSLKPPPLTSFPTFHLPIPSLHHHPSLRIPLSTFIFPHFARSIYTKPRNQWEPRRTLRFLASSSVQYLSTWWDLPLVSAPALLTTVQVSSGGSTEATTLVPPLCRFSNQRISFLTSLSNGLSKPGPTQSVVPPLAPRIRRLLEESRRRKKWMSR